MSFYLCLVAGGESFTRILQGALNIPRELMRAAHHAPRNPCRVFERGHSLVEIIQPGAGVLRERLCVNFPHLEGGVKLPRVGTLPVLSFPGAPF